MPITYSTDWSGIANNTLVSSLSGWTVSGSFPVDRDSVQVSTSPSVAVKSSTTNGALAHYNAGSDDSYIEVTYPFTPNGTSIYTYGPAVRCVDHLNHIGARIWGTSLEIYHRTASANYTRLSMISSVNVASGTKIALKLFGNTLRVYKDSVQVGSDISVSGIQSGSRVGFWCSNDPTAQNNPSIGAIEIGTTATDAITITSIKDREINSLQGATFSKTISGTYTGSVPVSVQYKVTRFVSGTLVQDWTTLDAAPSGGTFSGVINLPAAPYYKVEVRYSDKPAVTSASGRLGVGYLFEFGGQSNTSNKFQTGGDATPLDDTAIFNTGSTTWAIPTTQHVAHFLNAISSQFGCVVGAYTTAVGATSITQHIPSGGNYASRVAALTAIGGKLNGFYWGQGEGDVGAVGLYQSRLGELYTDILTRTGQTSSTLPMFVVQLGRNEGRTVESDSGWQGVRSAQTSFVSTTSNTYISHQTMDLPMDDDLHRNASGNKQEMLRSSETVIQILSSTGNSGRGPIPTSASLSGSNITIVHNLNGSASITLPTNAKDGYQVSNDDFATTLTISSISTSGSSITLTMASAPTGTVKVRSQYGQDPDHAKMPTGSKTYNGQAVMVEPIVNPITTSNPAPFTDNVIKQSVSVTTKTLNFNTGYNSNLSKYGVVYSGKQLGIVVGTNVPLNVTINKTTIPVSNKLLTVTTGSSVSFTGDISKQGITYSGKQLSVTSGTNIPVNINIGKLNSNIYGKQLSFYTQIITPVNIDINVGSVVLTYKNLVMGVTTYPIIESSRLFLLNKGNTSWQ